MVLASSSSNANGRSNGIAILSTPTTTNHYQRATNDDNQVDTYNQVSQQPFSYVRGRPQQISDYQSTVSKPASFFSSVSSSGYTSGSGPNQQSSARSKQKDTKYNNSSSNNLSSTSSSSQTKVASNNSHSNASNGLNLLQRVSKNLRLTSSNDNRHHQQSLAMGAKAPKVPPPLVPMMIDDELDRVDAIIDDNDNSLASLSSAAIQQNGKSQNQLRRRQRLIDGTIEFDTEVDDEQNGSFADQSLQHHRFHNANNNSSLSQTYQHFGDLNDDGDLEDDEDECADSDERQTGHHRHQIAYIATHQPPRYISHNQDHTQQYYNQLHHHHQLDSNSAIFNQRQLIAQQTGQLNQNYQKHHNHQQQQLFLTAANPNNIGHHNPFNAAHNQYYQPIKAHLQIPPQLTYSYHHLAHYTNQNSNSNNNNSIAQTHHQYIHPLVEDSKLLASDNQLDHHRRRSHNNSIGQTIHNNNNNTDRSNNQLNQSKMQTATRQHLSSPSPNQISGANQRNSNSSSSGGSRRKGTPHKSPMRNSANNSNNGSSKKQTSTSQLQMKSTVNQNVNLSPTIGCCGKLAKSILFMINLIFWSSGIALGAWGILTLVEDHKYNLSQLLIFEPNSRMSLFQLLSWSFITLGCATILVGFCGCSALFKDNRWILGLYIFLILAIFALDLATGLLAIIFQERLVANVRLRLGNKLRTEYGVQASFTAAIDYIQTRYECCGLEGHFDYDQSLWRLQRLGGFEATVARTCCHLRNTFDDQAHVNPRPVNESMCQSTDIRFHQSYRYRKGCLDELERLIRHKIWTFTTGCGAIGAIILLSLIFATCFCRSIPSQSSRKSSASSQAQIGSIENHLDGGKKKEQSHQRQHNYR